MKIKGDTNNDIWAELRNAKGKEEKKKILDKMISTQQATPQNNVNLTPNQMEAQKQQDILNTQRIAAKVSRGEYVNDGDMKYLEEKDPDLLSISKLMNLDRKRVENQVRNARTKREAQNILASAKQGALSLAMSGHSKGNDGGVTGMTLVSALDKAEENTRSEMRKKDRIEREEALERGKLKRKINKLV
jgi:hypothetical protein